MIRIMLIGLVLLGLQSTVRAENPGEIFTIYLVRHAEKDSEPIDPKDPGLSLCGNARAQSITRILSDIELEKIYSTPYKRTLETARPNAESRMLDIETYDPRELVEFSGLLLERQQDALVIGHSNTTGVLAGLLTGEGGEAFEEEIYDRLYQVVIVAGQGHVNLLHQAFRCER